MLGCGSWTAAVTRRGDTGLVTNLPFATLACGRRRNNTSTAQVVVAGPQSPECCAELADVFAWEHELELSRNGVAEWAGPVSTVRHEGSRVVIKAKDLFSWFDRRLLEEGFDRTDDIATLFDFVAQQALQRDTSPNITVAALPVGVVGRRRNDPSGLVRAGEMLRELARTGVPFTFVARDLFVGDYASARATTLLTTASFAADFAYEVDGMVAASEVVVYGARADVQGRVGGISGRLGLVQIVEKEPTIQDGATALVAANARLVSGSDGSFFVEGTLLPAADVSFRDLVPGTLADLRISAMCKQTQLDARLESVSVNVDKDGERVGVRYEPR